MDTWENLAASAPRHPEARNLLDLISMPELLEMQSYVEIIRILDTSGYAQADLGGVTQGWGRKVGEARTYTAAMVRTKAKPPEAPSIISIMIGSEGSYHLELHVWDADRPIDTEIRELAKPSRFLQKNIGPGVLQFLQTHQIPDRLQKTIDVYLWEAARSARILTTSGILPPDAEHRFQTIFRNNLRRMFRLQQEYDALDTFGGGEGI